MKFTVYCILFLLIFSSCERTIDFELDDVPAKLVVEATIENDEAPVVLLSKSQAYFSTIDVNSLFNSFVHDAEVYVSDGLITSKLKEFTVPVAPGINYYYYSNDPSDPTAFTGKLKTAYALRIVFEGKEYSAVTNIPDTTRRIDSIYWKQAPPGNPAAKVAVMLKATDRPGFGDYTRYFTKRNTEPFYPGLISVFDDQVIDGSTFDIQVERGIPRTGSTPDAYTYFNLGDTVVFKLSNINKATYDFWRTMEYTYSSVGNPFSSPTKVVSNILGGALGYFGGYASQYRTILIPQ